MSAPWMPGDVAVVIAARNEADRIAATVAAAVAAAASQNEVIMTLRIVLISRLLLA